MGATLHRYATAFIAISLDKQLTLKRFNLAFIVLPAKR